MRKFFVCSFAALLAAQVGSTAEARKRVVDGGNVSACGFDGTFGAIPTDGAAEISIGVYDSTCASTTPTQGFSLNIGGTVYSSMFVNENGIVSFGAPIGDSPATPLSNLSSPAFAPFFADGANSTTSLKYGWTDASVGFPNSIWLTWDSFTPEADPNATPNIFQLGIVDLGAGDFDLIFNYEAINWDSPTIGAQAGVTLGLGSAFLLAGAGTPGAYLGEDDVSGGSSVCSSATPSTALACNKINDGSQAVGGQDFTTGLPSNGYYLFKFRNGVLLDTPINEIPLPPAAGLFLLGAAAMGGRRLLRRRTVGQVPSTD